MSKWFCEYTKDGILTLHVTFDATDRVDAIFYLEDAYQIYSHQILDLREVLV